MSIAAIIGAIQQQQAAGGGAGSDITVIESADVGTGASTYNFVETLQENDYVVAVGSSDVGGQFSRTSGTAGYGNLDGGSWNNSPHVEVIGKRMGATPDTSFKWGQGAGAIMLQVLRGVDPTTALDVSPTAVSANANPPAITTATDRALVMAIAGLDDDGASTVTVWPTGYTNQQQANTGGSSGAVVGMSSKIVETAGAEDPSTYDFSSADAEASITLAFRPAP